MTAPLKPCGHCGKPPKSQGDYAWCNSEDCPMSGHEMRSAAWNTRPIEDALGEAVMAAKLHLMVRPEARLSQRRGQRQEHPRRRPLPRPWRRMMMALKRWLLSWVCLFRGHPIDESRSTLGWRTINGRLVRNRHGDLLVCARCGRERRGTSLASGWETF